MATLEYYVPQMSQVYLKILKYFSEIWATLDVMIVVDNSAESKNAREFPDRHPSSLVLARIENSVEMMTRAQ